MCVKRKSVTTETKESVTFLWIPSAAAEAQMCGALQFATFASTMRRRYATFQSLNHSEAISSLGSVRYQSAND